MHFMRTVYIIFIICFCTVPVAAQQQPIPLSEVYLRADDKLETFTNTQLIAKLNDSVIERNSALLTDILNINSSIYFKENGAGMVSSPSFRGTTAQQTAVLWNGININSQLNGQTDFNTITTAVFDAIHIRSGGGSVIYGSGAIGGTIHLSNALKFNKGWNTTFRSNYGSFSTYGLSNKLSFSDTNFSIQLGLNRTGSDNDFDYVDRDTKNTNGQYYNNSISLNAAYRINTHNSIKLYSYLYDGRRNFSLILPTETPTKYEDFNNRYLLEWESSFSNFVSKLKLAYLKEEYNYFANIAQDNFSTSSVDTFIAKYDLGYQFKNGMQLNGILSFNQNKGEGTNIQEETRNIGTFNLLLKQQLTEKFLYELTARKEVTNVYDSPFLYSAGVSYEVADTYTITANTSKNFRIPTFNDLYWQESGNNDLKPENSYQVELGNHFQFKNTEASLVGYYIDIDNMIRWLPNGAVWRAVNTDHVHTYGIEARLKWNKVIGKSLVSLEGNYAYTISKNKDTGNQLIYVPYHKGGATLGIAYKDLSTYLQTLVVSEVFTRSDNESQYNLDGYNLFNLGADYTLGTRSTYTLGFQIKNILNTNYQSVAYRFMPGRNYNFYLTVKL